MQKRKILIGTYDTALEGKWTLTAWTLSKAVAQEHYAEVPGHNGHLDLSTILTDGEPCYGSREFEAILESSEGTRIEREERINDMINKLDGWRFKIILPDDPYHYIEGRVRVERLFNTPAYASVQVSATCDPWRYNLAETVINLNATTEEQTIQLYNRGRRSVVPTVMVTGGSVHLKYIRGEEEHTWTLGPRDYEYILAGLYLKTGSAALRYSGDGQVTLTYREAVL